MAKQKAQPSDSIFTATDYQTLRRERRRLNDAIILLDKLQACGADCTAYKQIRDETEAQLAKIEELFMTPPPAV